MRNNLLFKVLVTACIFFSTNSFGQIKVVILGSSTAYGSGASSYSLSWPGLLQSYYNQDNTDGLDTSVINLAVPSNLSYFVMPNDFIPPDGRPGFKDSGNVTNALAYSPDVVIISLPSNDIGAGYEETEVMDNFRLMRATILNTGAKCFFTTPQPRNDYDDAQRLQLRELVDSVTSCFSPYGVDFWSDLVISNEDGDNLLRDPVRDPNNGFHVNDSGHYYLYQRILDRNIFGPLIVLPVSLNNFQAQLKDNAVFVKWHTERQEANTVFEVQKSTNGRDFETAFSQYARNAAQAKDYSGTDLFPLPGKSYYRIKLKEASGRQFYSPIVSVLNKGIKLNITRLYEENGANLVADITVPKSQLIMISLINNTGQVIKQQKQYVSGPSDKVLVPIANLASGQYYFSIITEDNMKVVKAFIK